MLLREGVARLLAEAGFEVIGQSASAPDLLAVAAVERERALEERDRGGGLLIGEHLDVGQAGSVVDADVHELPASGLAPVAVFVGAGLLVVTAAGDAVPGAAPDPAELLDVDVDQLARMPALIAIGRLRR